MQPWPQPKTVVSVLSGVPCQHGPGLVDTAHSSACLLPAPVQHSAGHHRAMITWLRLRRGLAAPCDVHRQPCHALAPAAVLTRHCWRRCRRCWELPELWILPQSKATFADSLVLRKLPADRPCAAARRRACRSLTGQLCPCTGLRFACLHIAAASTILSSCPARMYYMWMLVKTHQCVRHTSAYMHAPLARAVLMRSRINMTLRVAY